MKPSKKLLVLVIAGLLLSCDKDDEPVQKPIQATEFTGTKVPVGNGEAWTYVKTDAGQNPLEIGIQFDKTALINLPTGSMHADEFVLDLPSDIDVAPYDHMTLDWNEHGHEPMNVYDLPHFDIHFYFMSMAERNLISPTDSVQFNAPLAADYLAPQYLETPGGVPRMGAHIIDLLSPEIAGTGIFTHTFIYGKYDAKVNFLEPMVTKDFLDSQATVDQEIRQPASWQQSGYYPKRYTISYDASTEIYSIILKDLTKF
ncbi:MAG: DUF5602 domain-containing protein [Eudoraea sp.]|nr:DUF5602 domain-containing protein [Eudoraea sp.]